MLVKHKGFVQSLPVDHEKHHEHAHEFRKDGGNCGAVESKPWESPMPKDESVIEKDI